MNYSEVVKLIGYFEEIIKALNNINDENFSQTIDFVQRMHSKSFEIKQNLPKIIDQMELLKINEEIDKYTKQINKIFDNIVEEKRKELRLVGEKLGNVQNQKKLANYGR